MTAITFNHIPIDVLTTDEAIRQCVDLIQKPKANPQILVHINPHSLMVARRNFLYHNALRQSDIRLADGAGVVLVSRLRSVQFPERITGPDFLPKLNQVLNKQSQVRYFFYGSSQKVQDKIKERMQAKWPCINVVGNFSPPFSNMTDAEEAEHCAMINQAKADVLWVGMTAPKQELWAFRNKHRLQVPLIGCVGAAFDYLAQTKYRSPRWFRERHLEWLPRFFLEPRRLWRRNIVSTPLFLVHALTETFTGRYDVL